MKPHTVIILILVSITLLTTGIVDIDWQIVQYRYSEWHRSVDYWEYCPFLKINWWIAYFINIMRIIVGCILLGFTLNELRHIS